MVNWLVLVSIMIAIPAQSVTVKLYQKKAGGNHDMLFTAFIGLFALLIFVGASLFKGNIALSSAYLPYAVIFAVGYGMTFVFQILALSCGSMSLTALIQSYSLLFPTFYGVLFLHEAVSGWFYVGIVLLVICLFLINYQRKSEREAGEGAEGKKPGGITLKWLIFVWLCFVGEGICSTVQKVATVHLEEDLLDEFMVVAILIITVAFAVFGLIRERRGMRTFLRYGCGYGAACGIFSGAVNLAVIFLATRMPASIQFPLISAGSILFSLVSSVLLFKEKITRRQYVGVAVGIASIICLNL